MRGGPVSFSDWLKQKTSSAATDHFYTISTTERDDAVKDGYVLQSEKIYIYLTQSCGSIPLFRLFSATGKVLFCLGHCLIDMLIDRSGDKVHLPATFRKKRARRFPALNDEPANLFRVFIAPTTVLEPL
jgi:hypothetical protein